MTSANYIFREMLLLGVTNSDKRYQTQNSIVLMAKNWIQNLCAFIAKRDFFCQWSLYWQLPQMWTQQKNQHKASWESCEKIPGNFGGRKPVWHATSALCMFTLLWVFLAWLICTVRGWPMNPEYAKNFQLMKKWVYEKR